jgi:hypothetical protein
LTTEQYGSELFGDGQAALNPVPNAATANATSKVILVAADSDKGPSDSSGRDQPF